MTPPSSRQIALQLLLEWEGSETYAADLVERAAAHHRLAPRDVGLLQTLVLTTLRNIDLLDACLESVCDNRHLENEVHWLLRSGIAQLLLLDMPAHAVVNETVNQAGRARGLVNAVLRRVDRERAQLVARWPQMPVAVRTSHPDWLVRRWITQLAETPAEQLCEWNQQPASTYLRVNHLHPTPLSPEEILPLTPIAVRDFYQIEGPPREWLAQGRCYIQDPSTAISCDLLAPKPGETVLDACAAPGGKAAYLAQFMQNQGRLIVCDNVPRRLGRLQENLARLQVGIAECGTVDWTQPLPTAWQGLKFDRILVDAPCSNTGVMRRRVDVRWRLEPGIFAEMAALQTKILTATSALTKPGGALVYSTCSLDREENEDVVTAFLAAHPDFRLVETRASLPWRDGFDGAFAALLVKKGAAAT